MSAWEYTKTALRVVSPLSWLIAEAAEKSFEAVSKASDKGTQQLSDEVQKESLKMAFAQQQARVEQELAIARRIDNAVEVEIEEFYDTSGKGTAGLNADANSKTVSVGLGAEGRHVTKRVYRFKGRHATEEIEQSSPDLSAEQAGEVKV